MVVETRLSINCEQGRHHLCEGVYPWGVNGKFATCHCNCGHPSMNSVEPSRQVFYRGQRWRVLETGQIGALYALRFAPRLSAGYDTMTLLIDGTESVATFLRRELEEVIGG